MERLGFIYLCEGIHPQTKCFWKLSKTSFLVIKGEISLILVMRWTNYAKTKKTIKYNYAEL